MKSDGKGLPAGVRCGPKEVVPGTGVAGFVTDSLSDSRREVPKAQACESRSYSAHLIQSGEGRFTKLGSGNGPAVAQLTLQTMVLLIDGRAGSERSGVPRDVERGTQGIIEAERT
ncbi:MAG: hypothetical protein LQ341_004964 [Variospora aurantia]|nr:MAG: hypothetical protein LQ341_004964 [Variospora aurantia]